MNKGHLLPILSLLLAVAILLGLSFGLRGIAAERAQSEHLRLLRTVRGKLHALSAKRKKKSSEEEGGI